MRPSKVVSGMTVVFMRGHIGRFSMISSSSRAELASTIKARPMTPLIGPGDDLLLRLQLLAQLEGRQDVVLDEGQPLLRGRRAAGIGEFQVDEILHGFSPSRMGNSDQKRATGAATRESECVVA